MEINHNNLGKPSKFWDFFIEITRIPRCSGHEDQIRTYLIDKAKAMNYSYKTDNTGNLLIYPSNNPIDSNKKRIILQSHMDMVCEKDKDSPHNFSKDPLKLKILTEEDGKWLTAEKTTLGADNGVGIAFSLLIMDSLQNQNLQLENSIIYHLFTVEEETGLVGAFNIEKGFIQGDYLINLDSENETKFTIGCAGGITTVAKIPFETINIDEEVPEFIPFRLTVDGLRGGHSGVDINKGRGNAIKILITLLWKINKKYKVFLSNLGGGNLSNAIPRDAECIFYVDNSKSAEVVTLLVEQTAKIRNFISKSDSDVEIHWKKISEDSLKPKNKLVYPREFNDDLINILYIMPNGALRIDPDNPKLVITSSNLASIQKEENSLKITISHRSLYESDKHIISERIGALLGFLRTPLEIIKRGDYPGWQPNYKSSLLKKAKKTYMEVFQKEPIIQTIHAGLETGILKKTFPHIEMISLGPTIQQGHSPEEKLKVKSVFKIWNFLNEFLKEFDDSTE